MMSDKLIATIVAVGAYMLFILTLFYYFNYRNDSKPVHFVANKSEIMSVSIAPSTPKHRTKSVKKESPKSHTKPKHRKKVKPKPLKSTQKSHKPAKRKSRKRKKRSTRKRVDAKKLFSSVPKSALRSTTSSSKSSSKKSSSSIKKSSNAGKGVLNRYLASVERTLRGWPAQVNFAGEEVDVWLKIYKSGKFEYKVLKLSSNSEFNSALIAYLEQLKKVGLDPHSRSKPYEIEVKFVAHD
jgi:protein TonB